MNHTIITDTEVCGICKQNYTQPTVLKCKHIYCYNCIKEWYSMITISNSRNNYSNKRECPYCRQDGGNLPKKIDL
jgi:hypothetical protein